ncbi:hypothetical protein Hanom_Chr07g00676121 [Helianthus anomalus]
MYIPKKIIKQGGSKMYIPKNFYMKTICSPLLSEKLRGVGRPLPPPLCFANAFSLSKISGVVI